MAYPTGSIQVTNAIGTTAITDTYATHYDFLGSGGLMTIDTLANRNLIPALRRKFGMFVTVYGDSTPANNKTYILANVDLGGVNGTITDNSNWIAFEPGGGAGTAAMEQVFTANGSDTVFTVTAGTIDQINFVDINGDVQRQGTDYTISGQDITISPAPSSGDIITVRFFDGLVGAGLGDFIAVTGTTALTGNVQLTGIFDFEFGNTTDYLSGVTGATRKTVFGNDYRTVFGFTKNSQDGIRLGAYRDAWTMSASYGAEFQMAAESSDFRFYSRGNAIFFISSLGPQVENGTLGLSQLPTASLPPFGSEGRLVYDTDEDIVKYRGPSGWAPVGNPSGFYSSAISVEMDGGSNPDSTLFLGPNYSGSGDHAFVVVAYNTGDTVQTLNVGQSDQIQFRSEITTGAPLYTEVLLHSLNGVTINGYDDITGNSLTLTAAIAVSSWDVQNFSSGTQANLELTALSGRVKFTSADFVNTLTTTVTILPDSFTVVGQIGGLIELTDDGTFQRAGFFGATPVLQPVVPLGSTTNTVIQALLDLGLFQP